MKLRWMLRVSLLVALSLWLMKLFTTELLYYHGAAPGAQSVSGVAFRPIPELGSWRSTADPRETMYLIGGHHGSYAGQDLYRWLVCSGYLHATAVSFILLGLSRRNTKILLAGSLAAMLALWTLKLLKTDLHGSLPMSPLNPVAGAPPDRLGWSAGNLDRPQDELNR